MTDRNASCEDRIEEELRSEIERLSGLLLRIDRANAAGNYEKQEQAEEEMDPLAVDISRTVTIQMSTGGPGDQFECDIDEDGRIETIRYRFLDWFDGAVRTLSGHDLEVAERYCERYVELAIASEKDHGAARW